MRLFDLEVMSKTPYHSPRWTVLAASEVVKKLRTTLVTGDTDDAAGAGTPASAHVNLSHL